MPDLSRQVQALPGPALGQLIDRVGLADAAELVALATTEQLAQVFDEDLWQSARPGQDERFDSGRFLLWLEIMLEAGERFVAERLSELPPDLVTLAIHRHVLVISLDDLRAELEGDDDALAAEKAHESALSEELDDFELIWRGGDGWDSVLAALLALDRDHHHVLVELLERCAAMSREQIDDNGGLYAVLTSGEMLEEDLAAERETRRARDGYVAPSAAAAFLRLARGAASDETPLSEHDPLTRAYFRELDRAPRRSSGRAAQPSRWQLPALADQEARLVVQALQRLAEQAPALFAERAEELAYLSNVLLAGCSVSGRKLRPIEAVEHTLAVVSLGLWLSRAGKAEALEEASEALRRTPCDGLFRLACRQAPGRRPETSRHVDPGALAAVQALLRNMKV
jgi:hypothetical protein